MRLDPLIEVGGLYGILLAGLLAWAAWVAWQWHATWVLSAEVYEARREQGALAEHVDKAAFRRVFMAAEAPRRALHMVLAALAFILVLPPLMLVFSQVWYQVWTWTGRVEQVANGTMIYTFSLFLCAMGAMIGILWLAMRQYYTNLPPVLEDEVAKLNRSTS